MMKTVRLCIFKQRATVTGSRPAATHGSHAHSGGAELQPQGGADVPSITQQ